MHGLLTLKIMVVMILIQTLRFKFTGHHDSVYIFTKVGLEPYGRIGIGILELITAILLLIKRTSWLGAGITTGVISGAVIMHLTNLGIEVKGDSGLLFYTGIFVLASSLFILYTEKRSIPFL